MAHLCVHKPSLLPVCNQRFCDWCQLCANHSAMPASRKRAGAYRELMQRQQRQEKLGGLARKMAYDKEVGRGAQAARSCTAELPVHKIRGVGSEISNFRLYALYHACRSWARGGNESCGQRRQAGKQACSAGKQSARSESTQHLACNRHKCMPCTILEATIVLPCSKLSLLLLAFACGSPMFNNPMNMAQICCSLHLHSAECVYHMTGTTREGAEESTGR